MDAVAPVLSDQLKNKALVAKQIAHLVINAANTPMEE
jgi:hypothetical protein